MGFFDRLFGEKKGRGRARAAWTEVKHELHPGFVITAAFDESSPAEKAAFAALRDRWEADVRPQLDEDAKALCETYVEAPPPDDIFATMVDPSIRCSAEGTYEVTCTFDWQHEDDPHTVTFYFEGWKAKGSSVDG